MNRFPAVCAALALAAAAVAAAFTLPGGAAAEQRPKPVIVQIVGGNAAAPGQFPWMATIVPRGEARARVYCGATIIAPKVALTAAHCFEGPPEELDVIVGRTRLSRGRVGQRIAVTQVKLHESYNRPKAQNDIALLQLAEPANVTPIKLPRLEDAPLSNPGARTTSSGWGATEEGGNVSDDLLFVKLTARSQSTCERVYERGPDRYPIDYKTQICAGGILGEDTCQGDSGGPLFSGQGANATILGVVSFGFGCARADIPGVYTRVVGFSKWVRDNTALLNGDTPTPPVPGDLAQVAIRKVSCGAILCRVQLRVTGRTPAGGVLLNVTRRKTRKLKAVDRYARASERANGTWSGLINLPVGNVTLRATPLNATGDQIEGRGAVERYEISQG